MKDLRSITYIKHEAYEKKLLSRVERSYTHKIIKNHNFNHCCEFVVRVAGSWQSEQNAGLSEQQQGYLFQTKEVNSAQDFTNKHMLGL